MLTGITRTMFTLPLGHRKWTVYGIIRKAVGKLLLVKYCFVEPILYEKDE